METLNQFLSTVFPQGNLESYRKSYCKPELKELGDLRAITLSGSYVGTDFSSTDTCLGDSGEPC